MVELLFYNSGIVTLSVAFCAVLAAIGAMTLARRMFFMSTASVRRFFELRFRPTALRYTEEFEYLFEGYRQKVMALGEFAITYSAVFNEAKWARAILAIEDLRRAHRQLCAFLEEGESKDALCLSEFLIAAGEELTPWKYQHINDEWAPLAKWEQEVHAALSHVVKALPAAARQSHSVGMVNEEELAQTLKIVEQVRAAL